MSLHLHPEIVFARQHEITASPVDPDDLQEPYDADSVPHLAKYRVRRAVTGAAAAAAICLGVVTIAATGAPTTTASSSPAQVAATQAVSPSAAHLQRSIRTLESEGYVAKACTTKGMLMSDPRTGRATTVTY